jgi:tRNA splicing endonuclease
MDTPIAMILMFDWTADFIESVREVVVVLRDVEDRFFVVKSGIKFN